MKNYTIGLLFILFGFSAFAQGITPKEGYYRTVNNYKQDNIDPAGELVSATSTDLVFKYLYNKVYYNSRNVWGYRDKNGNDYRSIDGKFYQIINGKKIFVFELKENNETIHKISFGAGGFPLELSSDNLLKLMADNPALVSQYKSLSGREKKEKAIEFIARYNESQAAVNTLETVSK